MRNAGFFLRIYIRNLFTNKEFRWINIIGLSVGVTVSLLILLYVRYETSFEQFNPNAGNIYRIVTKNNQDGSIGAATPLALSDVLISDYPEIEKVTSLIIKREAVKTADERYDNFNGAIVGKDFFSLFNFPLKAGNPSTLFQEPYEAVVTKHFASVLFGNTDPLAKTFEFENQTFTVTGIIEDLPSNSIFSFDYFLSDKFRYKYYPDLNERWYDFGLYTFVTFHGNRVPDDFENKLSSVEEKYFPDFMKNRLKFLITSFKGSHLNPLLGGDLKSGVTPGLLWTLSLVAFGILVIACLNFMNISIANSSKRNTGTAIKKVTGATSAKLIRDFFTELAFIVLCSMIISLFGTYLLLPIFNRIIEKSLEINLSDPVLWIGLAGFGVFTILLSGLYPSIVLARPSPMKILLHNRDGCRKKMTFQKSIVVMQFIITVALLITQLFIFKQIKFMQNHSTGFNRENLISVPVQLLGNSSGQNERLKNTELFIQRLNENQDRYGFDQVTVTEFIPGLAFKNRFKIFPDDDVNSNGLELLSCDVDENFLQVFGLHTIEGRFFSKNYSTDHDQAIVINETALRELGWNSIEGKSVGLFTKDNRKNIIGVVNDINIASMQLPIRPMIFQFGDHHNYPGYITLRLNNKKAETIDYIKGTWTELFPGVPFSYENIDERFKEMYGAEKKLVMITGLFSILAILLSLFGIFALSVLEVEKRIKEIGIRKINGAKSGEIIKMLTNYYIKWISIAYVAGVPFSILVTTKWLQNYSFRTGLNWWVFAFAGIIILAAALLTISWQSWKAATRNPVESLRYE